MTQAYPGYPPQTAQPYPPQPFQQPAYPPPPQYAPQFPAAQGYPAPQLAPPAAPLAQGSIDDFYSQPSTGGGKALTFAEQPGTRYVGIVTRALTSGDIQQQTDTRGVPQFFKDGRPKFVMKVPLQMQASPTHPDGLGTWFVKGARDELVRAMAEAGAPAGPPEAGSIIDVTHTANRASGAGMNPAKLFHVVYTRPTGETSSPAPQPVQPQPQAPVQYAQPAQTYAAAPTAPPVYPQQGQQAPVPQPPATSTVPQPPADLSPEQQALLAKLTGG